MTHFQEKVYNGLNKGMSFEDIMNQLADEAELAREKYEEEQLAAEKAKQKTELIDITRDTLVMSLENYLIAIDAMDEKDITPEGTKALKEILKKAEKNLKGQHLGKNFKFDLGPILRFDGGTFKLFEDLFMGRV